MQIQFDSRMKKKRRSDSNLIKMVNAEHVIEHNKYI